MGSGMSEREKLREVYEWAISMADSYGAAPPFYTSNGESTAKLRQRLYEELAKRAERLGQTAFLP